MKNKITVSLPLEVLEGDYCYGCWGTLQPFHCEWYDNPGGHSQCTLPFNWFPIRTKEGVIKASECKKLKTI